MSTDQRQVPQPGQPIREGQSDVSGGQEGHAQDESQNKDHLIEEGDGIPGGTEEGEAPGEIRGDRSDARQSKANAKNPDVPE